MTKESINFSIASSASLGHLKLHADMYISNMYI
jgi:hypothetical protein